jgi:hypothetical protein
LLDWRKPRCSGKPTPGLETGTPSLRERRGGRQLAAARGTVEAFDGVAELWWDSLDDLVAALGSEDGQRANAGLAEDEARFIDLERSSLFLT